MTDLEKAQLETQFWKAAQEEAANALKAANARADAAEKALKEAKEKEQ